MATNKQLKQQKPPWDRELVRTIGKEMRKARGSRSARWLSDETAALGLRVSPTIIAKLDSGRRGNVLSVPELLVLAAALKMPPALLIFPGYPDGEVEHLPGRESTSQDAVDWVSGANLLPYTVEVNSDGVPIPVYGPSNVGVELVAAMRDWREQLERLPQLAKWDKDGKLPEGRLDRAFRDADASFAKLSRHIDELHKEYDEKGTDR